MKKLKRIALIGIIGLFAFALLSAWNLSDRILFPKNASFEKSKQRLSENNLSYKKLMANLPEPQAFKVLGADSIAIKGWYFEQADSASCGVVMAHGWTGTRIDMLKYSHIFSECGCDLVMYDHRMHGESGGEFATGGIKEKHDLIAVTDWLEQQSNLSTSQIGWLGVSWGGGTVLQAGAIEKEIGFIIADSPFQDWYSAIFERAIKEYGSKMKFFAPLVFAVVNARADLHFRDASALEAATDIEAPVLLIHSMADSATSSSQSVNIATRLETDSATFKFYHTDWGAGHARDIIENREQYTLLVNDFIKKYIGSLGSCE